MTTKDFYRNKLTIFNGVAIVVYILLSLIGFDQTIVDEVGSVLPAAFLAIASGIVALINYAANIKRNINTPTAEEMVKVLEGLAERPKATRVVGDKGSTSSPSVGVADIISLLEARKWVK